MKDEKDAGDLADLLRMGRLPEAWIAAELRELRELTCYRVQAGGIRTSCKELGPRRAGKLGSPVTCSDIFGVWGSTWLGRLELELPHS